MGFAFGYPKFHTKTRASQIKKVELSIEIELSEEIPRFMWYHY
jgi:hypothetical protein